MDSRLRGNDGSLMRLRGNDGDERFGGIGVPPAGGTGGGPGQWLPGAAAAFFTTWIRPRLRSMVRAPIPLTSASSSMLLKGP